VIRGALGHDVARSLRDAGAPARIASDIAQAIALHPPLRNMPLDGSRFDVTYEAMPDASVGFILAEFTVNGTHQRIWRYRPEGGLPGFYTDDGTHIGGLTMQSPVPGAPIVSPYGMRKHPVLHDPTMQWGGEYEANTGTPILSAADGTIADARRLGNYGLYIRVSHSDGVETTYGHLSRFETGIHAGTPVKAGQVIGYAGSSGLASGPHLYFEVMVEGKRVDPRHMVSNEPLRLSGADLALFESLKQQAAAVQTASQRP
jgi:murein DD-endopeptidase MepM/ murein hydrolase activator NlpD